MWTDLSRELRAGGPLDNQVRIPVAVSTERQQMGAETAGSMVQSRTNPRRASNTKGRSSVRHRTLPGPSGIGGTIEQWQSQLSARALSALAASSRRSQRELRASPAVSPPLSRRRGGAGKRRRRAARARGRERGSGGARRAAAPHGRRAGFLRAPLALARSSESGRRPAPRTRSVACSRRCRRRAGSCGIRCDGPVVAISIRWRSLRPDWWSRSRLRRGFMTDDILIASERRPTGLRGAAGVGHAGEGWRSSAWCGSVG